MKKNKNKGLVYNSEKPVLNEIIMDSYVKVIGSQVRAGKNPSNLVRRINYLSKSYK
jgi:hypothetical protein|tara:strand:+ start:987 stop:1154 length:168 start_codon:yes stop_codon:yes gene_type:complete